MFEAPAKPHAKTLKLIDQCYAVLERSPHALGCRAIYYRLVGPVFPKPESGDEADRITNRIERAMKIGRDLELVPWDCIVDTTRNPTIWSQYLDTEEWMEDALSSLAYTPWPDQPQYVEAFVEAEGLKGHFDAELSRYFINVEYGRGNSSWTALRKLARRIETMVEKYNLSADPIILTFGDLNPAGQNISECVDEAMMKWCYPPVDVRRVCLLPEDLDRYDLHGKTYPVKADDKKAKGLGGWTGECCELEAMSDDQIAERIREEVEKVIKPTKVKKANARSKKIKRQIREMLSEIDNERR